MHNIMCLDLQKPRTISQELKFKYWVDMKVTLLHYPDTPTESYLDNRGSTVQ